MDFVHLFIPQLKNNKYIQGAKLGRAGSPSAVNRVQNLLLFTLKKF